MSKEDTREATVSSIFYPGKEEDLINSVRTFIESSKEVPDDALIILAPHAGYSYAGRFMGDAYKTASRRDIKRVLIISRVHREPEKAIFLPSYSAFDTPAGALKVDRDTVEKLLSMDPAFKIDNIPHMEEHSIEVQLPFIRYLWPEAEIVPILTGFPSLSLVKKLSSALKKTAGDDSASSLFVISSNLSSYDHPKAAERDTGLFMELLDQHRWEEFPLLLDNGKINACSADGLTALYLMFNGQLEHRVLSYDCGSSREDKGIKRSHEKRVCFGAISFYKNIGA